MISEDAILAVKRGIYWLDENHPGWASRINLDKLEMAACSQCVIGQAVGDYSDTIRAQHNGYNNIEGVVWAVDHGFESPNVLNFLCLTNESPTYAFDELDTLWSEEVKNRRSIS